MAIRSKRPAKRGKAPMKRRLVKDGRAGLHKAELALRKSEERFRSLTHLSSDWYWEQDEQFRMTFMSKRMTEKTGLDRSAYIGHRRWDRPALNLTEADWQQHRALLERHEPFRDFEMQREGPGGRIVWLSISGEPVFDARGRFKGYRGIGRDITERKRAEQALRRSEERFRGLAELSSDWYWEQDEQFRFVELGEQKRNKDSRPKNYTGRTRWELHPRSLTPEQWAAHRAQLEAHQPFYDLEFQRPGADGRMYWVSVSGRPIFDQAGCFRGYRGIGRDITAQKHAEGSLRESEARFRSLTQMSSDFFWETDEQSRFTQLVHGPSYVAQFGNLVIGKAAWDLPSIMPDEAGWARLRATIEARESIRDFEFGRTRADGAVRYFSVSGEPRYGADGRFLGYCGVGRDITEIVLSRDHIASLAYSDLLTGLANRTSLVPALEQAVERARRRSTHLATMFIDLDGFKQMNDAYGHASGDRFLIETARRLRASVRASDMVARLGGDEFFVVLEDVPDAILVETVARKLLAEIMRPFELVPGDEMRVSASVGIAVFPDDAADAATLMKHADMAMYKAKQAGKNDFRFFAETSPDYGRSKITSS